MGRNPEDVARELAELEEQTNKREEELKSKYPEVFVELLDIARARGECEELKRELKSLLIARDDLDNHEVDGRKYSVSKIVRLEADNIDLVPDEFKSVQVVADTKKAQDYYKLMGVAPDGFKDKSYHRLNWGEM